MSKDGVGNEGHEPCLKFVELLVSILSVHNSSTCISGIGVLVLDALEILAHDDQLSTNASSEVLQSTRDNGLRKPLDILRLGGDVLTEIAISTGDERDKFPILVLCPTGNSIHLRGH